MKFIQYATSAGEHFKYELQSATGAGPKAQTVVPPFFPAELLNEKQAGRVVVDVQVDEIGVVAGLWLISSNPEVFSVLATEAVREWKFEPTPMKIRVVLQFVP